MGLLLGVLACSNDEPRSAPAVAFRIDSPFCGPNAYPFRFSIDQSVVGNDTLRDGQTSPRFTTTPGQHHLNALVTGGVFPGFARDTTVMLTPDAVFTYAINSYCS